MKKWGLISALAFLLLVPAPAPAQDAPKVVSPLKVEMDPNGVNIIDGKMTFPGPVLSIPAAPRLRYDRVQNVAPYLTSLSPPGDPGTRGTKYSIHTGSGPSEQFGCSNSSDCTSLIATGSILKPGGRTLIQAGTGAIYDFNRKRYSITDERGISTFYYASTITYPDGEVISFTYDTGTLPDDPAQAVYYRPTRIASSIGYHIELTYGNDNLGDIAWGQVKQAILVKDTAPTVALAKLTHGSDGETDIDNRVFNCSGCPNVLGANIEVSAGSLQLPGESAATLVVTNLPNRPVIQTVTRDGVTWTYAYTNLRLNNDNYIFDKLTVTGPENYHVVYDFTQFSSNINVLTKVTDSLNRVTLVGSDFYSRIGTITYPEGNVAHVDYDEFGNISLRTLKAKPSTGLADLKDEGQFGFTDCKDVRCYRPNWVKDALLRQTDFAYNAAGQVTTQTDPADALGVRRQTINTYTTGISRKSVVRLCGTGAACNSTSEVRTEYDYLGSSGLPTAERRVNARDGVTLTTTYAYDPAGAGRVTSIDGPSPGTADAQYFRYDVLGRKTWEIGELGPNGLRITKRYTYRDADDKVTKVETGTVSDPDSTTLVVFSRVDTTYDSHRQPAREAAIAGGVSYTVTDRSFDDRGNLECEAVRMNTAAFGATPVDACTLTATGTQGNDRITHNVYDAAGQLKTVQRGYKTNLVQDYARYDYSDNGKRKSVTDANGNIATMTYDGFDRQARWYFPLAATGATSTSDYEEYTYDKVGNRKTLRKRDGSVLTYNYDDLNRVVSKIVPERAGLDATHTRDVYYDYDLRDLQLYARYDSNGGARDGISNVYDPLGRLTLTTQRFDGVGLSLQFQYDAHGNRTQLTHPGAQKFSYAYDALDRLSGVYEGAGTAVPLATFTYNNRGLPDTRSERYGSAVAYSYDVIGRLKTLGDTFAGTAGDVTTTFGYNPASQLATKSRSNDAYAWTGVAGSENVERSYAVNGLNQYKDAGGPAFSYDANGNLKSDGTTTFGYDIENRLVTATGAKTATLRYDPVGRLYEVVSGTTTDRFLYDGDALVAEYDGTGNLTDRYVHGADAGADDPLVWYPTGQPAKFLHRDHQGSIVALATGPDGALAAINAYDEYGIPKAGNIVATGTGNTGRFQYTGQIWLGELGLYHYKARAYSPPLGRFLQTDPVGYGGGMNIYAYVANDPVNQTDPTGMAGEDEYRISIGGLSISASEDRISASISGLGSEAGASISRSEISASGRIGSNEAKVSATRSEITAVAKADQRTFQTYIKTNPATDEHYTGRTSGTGTPAQNVARRDADGYPSKDYGPARLDK